MPHRGVECTWGAGWRWAGVGEGDGSEPVHKTATAFERAMHPGLSTDSAAISDHALTAPVNINSEPCPTRLLQSILRSALHEGARGPARRSRKPQRPGAESNVPHRAAPKTRGEDPRVQAGPVVAGRPPAHGRGLRQHRGRHHPHRRRRPDARHAWSFRPLAYGGEGGQTDQRLDRATAPSGSRGAQLPRLAAARIAGAPERLPPPLHQTVGSQGRNVCPRRLHQPPGRWSPDRGNAPVLPRRVL